VDYSSEVAARLAAKFFGGQSLPAKNWNGAPFYSYFFGLDAAEHNYVFHMESDMMYGGGSRTWVAEAVRLLIDRPDVLVCNPLPGPPTADGRLRSQTLRPEPLMSLAYRADFVSTRLFLIDRDRLHSRVSPLMLTQPPRRRRWQALGDGNPPYEAPEVILSREMSKRGLLRIDFLGSAPGMWSVHPPYRSKGFYERLPQVIEQIEKDEIPDAQRGHHDLTDRMVDWTGARKPKWRRVAKHLRLCIATLARTLAAPNRRHSFGEDAPPGTSIG
jgi:hypothetical protein